MCITGNICKEPAARTTQTGKKNTQVRVAVKRPFARDTTDFFTVIAWGQNAEYLERYAHKGGKLAASGTMQIRKYTAQDGSEREAYELVADRVELIRVTEEDAPARAADEDRFEEVEDDDLPF